MASKTGRNRGLAYDPTRDFLRYSDGTVNHWNKIERPGVVIENGHVTHFTFAVIDVAKEQDLGNDTHGSKIIVVPFDGAALDPPTGARIPGQRPDCGKNRRQMPADIFTKEYHHGFRTFPECVGITDFASQRQNR